MGLAFTALLLLRPQFPPCLHCQERWVPVEQTGEKTHSHHCIWGQASPFCPYRLLSLFRSLKNNLPLKLLLLLLTPEALL